MKLIDDYKRRRRDEQELRQSGRMPPGQSLTNRFPVMMAGPIPHVDTASWELRVFGEVEHEMRWSWEAFLALPTVTVTVDVHCVTRWSKFDTVWEGVLFRDFVELFSVKDTAKHVIAHCDYGYTTNVPIEDMMKDDVLLAYKYDGKPLEPEHGFPVRTLVPHLYFWKSAKHLRGLEFSAVDKPGFWENAGYHNYGDPFKEERYQRRGFF
ncbi:MAG: sulfite oxidase-like oxidoreductase [Chloroflexi bacterium]|nr:MAG: sulfite oxidase-like oxidoreductase [Chloroflexota bacterium]